MKYKARVFVSPQKARKAGVRACEGKALRFKVEQTIVFNGDRSADMGYKVSLWGLTGVILKGWVRE